jgi:predicted enzyme related to lactoylglutathione lyase
MSDSETPEVGAIAWRDLTVDDAEKVREFYGEVVGWKAEPVDMGGYSDFNMTAPGSGTPMAGVCHRRGSNADLPAQWLMYVIVESLERSVARCEELGGEVVVPPKGMAEHGRYCVIRDPAGAVCALFQPATSRD